MTCIIGYKDDKDIYIASDSASTALDGTMDLCKVKKIIRIKDYLIGYAGAIRPAQIFRTKHFSLPKDDSDIINFVESYREAIDKGGCMSIDDKDGAEESSTMFIIAHKNHLYVMYSDFQVHELDSGFISLGSGGDFAHGALYILKDSELSTEKKLEKALEASAAFSTTVKPPWNIVKY